MSEVKPKLRWYQFSLRTMLLFVLLCSLPLSWIGVKLQQVRRQRAVVEAIEELGGWVTYGYQYDESGHRQPDSAPPTPTWLRTAVFVAFPSVKTTDVDLEHLKDLPALRGVNLCSTAVGDAGVEHLTDLSELRELYLHKTEITNVGLGHLEALPHLQELNIGWCSVTDAGLEHLAVLTQLQRLDLSFTDITDVGLEHLEDMTSLKSLDLIATEVTAEGVKKLQEALPECEIVY